MSDTLKVFGKQYSNLEGIKAIDNNGNIITFTSDSTSSTTTHGETEWTEVTITTAATNTADCINILFPNRQPYHYYVAQLIEKSRSNYTANQLIQYTCVTDSSQNAVTGCGTRWRNNAFSSYSSTLSNYDAVIEVGDTFLVSQTAYTISDT